ncbi:anti-sigma regulatory factor [Kineosporia succinea]|uniref:Serine/threonine-protein kinase RsbW n=1 Tax=Kineosporia succinea TaxID=84632 RepID=A0ABT9P1T7_9ACTN|nr:anti-sigma regulatory factor [Kineosporia succinea]MDP9826646.1 serine/threonine-protein kinase RsbW [Kineosporia succinea]
MSTIRGKQRSDVVEQARRLDTVDLRVPADPAYLAVVRTAAAGLGTRLDLTLDEIEDLRIAVDEACSLLLAGRAHPGRTLDAAFEVGLIGSQSLAVTITGPVAELPREASFSWSVLRALAGDVITGADPDGAWIKLSVPTTPGRAER